MQNHFKIYLVITAACAILLFDSQAIGNQPASQDSQDKGAPPQQEPERKKVRDHFKQGIFNLGFGTGVYMVAPYEKDDPELRCGPDDEDGDAPAVCTGRTGWHMDILGGYGVARGLELLLMYRQGLEDPDMGKPQQRMFGGGVKAYKPSDGLFKIGIGAMLLFDFSERNGDPGGDFVIQIPISAQFDIVRWFGTYAQVAPTVSFITEFRFDINMGFGFQARFP